MALSSQELSKEEQKQYEKLLKSRKVGKQVEKIRADIISSVITRGSKVSKAVAREIRVRILTDPKFNK